MSGRVFGVGWFIDAVFICRLLSAKIADEERALDLCRTKARQKKLPMEVIDAEFQWWVGNYYDLGCGVLTGGLQGPT